MTATQQKQQIPGKFVWYEHVSKEPRKAQAFYQEVLGWRVEPFPMGDTTYEMICKGDEMLGGYTAPSNGEPAHWISYASVEDVDAAAKKATSSGGKVVAPPVEAPEVGRWARIADPQGAEFYVFKSATGNSPDRAPQDIPPGQFIWNELHTTDAQGALSFYEKVVGFTHTTHDLGPGGTYHVIARGGVDRGGITAFLAPGSPPHWLPYVCVEDADATIARARKAGATIQFGPENIPGVGRFGTIQDPTGAVFAVLKPIPAAPG
jgi:uncharacterized protein